MCCQFGIQGSSASSQSVLLDLLQENAPQTSAVVVAKALRKIVRPEASLAVPLVGISFSLAISLVLALAKSFSHGSSKVLAKALTCRILWTATDCSKAAVNVVPLRAACRAAQAHGASARLALALVVALIHVVRRLCRGLLFGIGWFLMISSLVPRLLPFTLFTGVVIIIIVGLGIAVPTFVPGVELVVVRARGPITIFHSCFHEPVTVLHESLSS